MYHAGVQEQDNHGEQHFCLSSLLVSFSSSPFSSLSSSPSLPFPPLPSLPFPPLPSLLPLPPPLPPFHHPPLIQLDCGIHPGLSGMDALPYTDMIEADEIDLLLITQ